MVANSNRKKKFELLWGVGGLHWTIHDTRNAWKLFSNRVKHFFSLLADARGSHELWIYDKILLFSTRFDGSIHHSECENEVRVWMTEIRFVLVYDILDMKAIRFSSTQSKSVQNTLQCQFVSKPFFVLFETKWTPFGVSVFLSDAPFHAFRMFTVWMNAVRHDVDCVTRCVPCEMMTIISGYNILYWKENKTSLFYFIHFFRADIKCFIAYLLNKCETPRLDTTKQ